MVCDSMVLEDKQGVDHCSLDGMFFVDRVLGCTLGNFEVCQEFCKGLSGYDEVE